MDDSGIRALAESLRERNRIDRAIAERIGRPAERGHIGEFIASRIFGIDLHESAAHRGHDGVFRGGEFEGRTVNIKWYGKDEGLLDVATTSPPDLYLVLTGPRAAAVGSRGTRRPLVVSSVYLFRHGDLIEGGVRPGTAASVRRELWEEARIHPGEGGRMSLTADQVGLLSLLAPAGDEA